MIAVLSFEFSILDWIQSNLRNPILNQLMPAITALGNSGLIWILLSGILLLMPKYRKTGAAVLAGLVLEVVCCSRSRLWIPSLVLAVLIAFSRLYLYVHYPTDILAGMLLGITSGWLGSLVSCYAGERLHFKS